MEDEVKRDNKAEEAPQTGSLLSIKAKAKVQAKRTSPFTYYGTRSDWNQVDFSDDQRWVSTENGYGFVLGGITFSTCGKDYGNEPRYPYKWDGPPQQPHPREFLKEMYKEAYNCRLLTKRTVKSLSL